jgi:hypothetical protein
MSSVNHSGLQHTSARHLKGHSVKENSSLAADLKAAIKGPTGNLIVKGNVIDTGKYEIVVSKDEVIVKDKETGKWFRVWGDPHLETSDGDKLGFTQDNLTIDLPDGTKITIVPTEANADGVAYIDTLYVMQGSKAVEVENIHGDGAPEFGEVTDDAA